MAKKKKNKGSKPHGHYCWVCGEHKANEKFSGRGHATHMCKKCHALPVSERNKMVALRKIGNMGFRYISEQEIKWLRKKMKALDPEIREAAREVYDIKFSRHDSAVNKLAALKTPVTFSELDDDEKSEALEMLEELIDGFLLDEGYLPDDEDKDAILAVLSGEMSDMLNRWKPEPYDPLAELFDTEAEDFDPYAEPEEDEPKPQKELVADAELKAVVDKIVAEYIAVFKENGIELPTFMETLLVIETERLTIRRFYKKDLDALYRIMSKPEVMYAWEAGFHKREVRKWLNSQYTRYHKDGYGYFAVTLKDSCKLIGQAGLMKIDLNGETTVELGYIFDNRYWGQGYAVEAARACIDLAFGRFGQDKLYATVRPENTASVKLTVKLGMRKIGEITKAYKGKEMLHEIFLLEKSWEDTL